MNDAVRKVLVASLFFLATLDLLAQQDPQFTHYMFNTVYYNPAFSGIEGVTRLTAIHRSQWLGYQPSFGGGGAPSTQMISFSTPVYKFNSGFSAFVLNDKLGPQNNLEAQLGYAYHIQIKGGKPEVSGKVGNKTSGNLKMDGGRSYSYITPFSGSKLSFGMKVGLYSQTINFNQYRPIDQNDPLLNGNGKESQIRPDISLGTFYQHNNYYVGLSLNHLIKSSFDFGLSQRNALESHIYLTGGYLYEVNFDLKLQFSTLIKSDFTKTTFDLGGIAYYKDTMWGGLSFRQSEAAILMIGYSALKDKSLRFGYALDYVIKDQQAKQPTSHELLVTYSLPVNPASGKKVVRTPRYRH